MPIYEYTCSACGKSAEILQKLSEAPAKKCPSCGKPKLTKQISAAGFRLSGGGWYETDFKKDGKKNLAGDKPEGTPAKAEKSESKSDSKSDAAPKAEKSEAKSSPKAPAKDGKSDKKKAAAAD